MSSRDEIIARIRQVGREPGPMPEIPPFSTPTDLVAKYKKSLEANKASIIECTGEEEFRKALQMLAAKHSSVVSTVAGYDFSTVELATVRHPSDLRDVELAIVEADIGVAENGANWLPEQNLKVRALPFIVLHLAIVMRKQNLVDNMHEAYKKIGSLPGFGSFIAGPSKTADIEQALVIGAHGPKSLVVVLIG